MRIVQRLILVIGLALTVSCAATTPAFPPVNCEVVKLTDEQIQGLKTCLDTNHICSVPFTTIKRIFDIVQAKSECIEQYKAGASKFKG
jgi:hypothetical protein